MNTFTVSMQGDASAEKQIKARNQLWAFVTELAHDLRHGLDLQNSKSDTMVQHHFNGLFSVMLGLVSLFLLASIAVIALIQF